MKRTKKAIASIAIAGMALTMIPFNALAEGTFPTRLGGQTAIQTAVQIADQTGWTGKAILSSPTSYGMVDALTAGPLATFLKAPILLQEAGNVLNPDTKAQLIKLDVKTVYVTSGTAVISQAVLNQLTSMGIEVIKLGGVDRFETSVNIANKMIALGADVNKVAIAYGWLNQDALSIASIASAQTAPILLTDKNTIPASVKAFLTTNPSVTTTDVIGGTGVISEAVKTQFPSPTRHFGYTAYDTNLAVLKAFDSVLKYDRVFIANGETAIDALAGAPLAAIHKAGIVLTKGTANEGTRYASSKLTATSVVTALGGTAVVPEAIRAGVVSGAPVDPVTPPVIPPVKPPSGGGGGGGGGGTIDTIAPVITLLGSSTVSLANGASYTDAGVTITDNKDTNLTATVTYKRNGIPVSSINTSVAGTYVIYYNVSDAAGNAAIQVTRTVNVAAAVVAEVNNATQLNNALADLNITNIIFTGDINNTDSLPLTANHSLNIDFQSFTLTGDLTFSHTGGGTSILTGTAADSIIGNLTVDTENASFENGVAIDGDVTIADVKNGTWTEKANGNVIIITDANGAKIIIIGSPGAITVSESATGGITLTIGPDATVTNIVCNAPVNLVNNGIITNLIANASISLVNNNTTNHINIGGSGTVINKTDLTNAIAAATALIGSKTVGTAAGQVPQAAHNAFQSAIAAATAVKNSQTATQAQVSAQVAELALATANFNSAINQEVMVKPTISDYSMISGATLVGNTLTFSLTNQTVNSGFVVSKNSLLSFSSPGLGTVGNFSLTAGETNSLLNPIRSNLNMSEINFTGILNAVKALDATSKQELLEAVNFTELFNLVGGSDPSIIDAVLSDIDVANILAAVQAATPEAKQEIIDNMASVMDLAVSDPNKSTFKSKIMLAMLPTLNYFEDNAVEAFLDSAMTTTDLRNLYASVEDPDDKINIINNINYPKLFEAIMVLEPGTRTAVFTAINFTLLFDAIKDADSTKKDQIYEDMLNVAKTLATSGISHGDILDTIVFGPANKANVYKILNNLDGDPSDSAVTMTVTLTDKLDANNTNTYTVIIQP